MELCEKLVEALARRHPGTLIVSGLAYGIDICAHRSALKFGLPTAAVLAHGLDRIYPGRHRSTAREMAFKGALVRIGRASCRQRGERSAGGACVQAEGLRVRWRGGT